MSKKQKTEAQREHARKHAKDKRAEKSAAKKLAIAAARTPDSPPTKEQYKWKPGHSGNPLGTTRVWSIRRIIEYVGGEQLTAAESGTTVEMNKLEFVVRRLFKLSADGDVTAMRLLFERLEGRPVQTVAVTGSTTHAFVSVNDADSARIMSAYLRRLAEQPSAGRAENASVDGEAGLRISNGSSARN